MRRVRRSSSGKERTGRKEEKKAQSAEEIYVFVLI